ncbi:hypothetical protein WR25_13527 [Diploscapter pachys]|uniref:Secreted protein n=1 Tax=Diploscapter pachys TaxID=2018661 RepID=A0A2A2KFT5_9BILA|nr:hypothetical protein WR25_13527 [Diploscapter pachys]
MSARRTWFRLSCAACWLLSSSALSYQCWMISPALEFKALFQQLLKVIEDLHLSAAGTGNHHQYLLCGPARVFRQAGRRDRIEQRLAADTRGRGTATQRVTNAAIGEAHGGAIAWLHGAHAEHLA